jgi:hypothetical protein
MFGGLKKSASRLAIVAAAGVLSTSAYAADLGGDCCADLEERVAELEATTARKGNRKMSLTVYGWVNKTVMGWNDGTQKNVFLGVDNINSATRFGFRGDAKVSPTLKAGYSILLDINSGASSAVVNQLREEAPTACAVTANPAIVSACGVNAFSNDHSVRMRDANVWLESSSFGRVTLGRLTVSGPQGTIDLGGISNVASGSQSLVGGAFLFRDGAGSFGNISGTGVTSAVTAAQLVSATPPNINLANATDNFADYNNRADGLKWDSPTFAGFVVGASIGEALKVQRPNNGLNSTDNATGAGPLGQIYAINLRYAGEFAGVRVAAAAGYEVTKAEELSASTNTGRPDSKNLGLSLSGLHVPTGLFAQGHWIEHTRGNNDGTADKAKNWLVQAGISQNFFGIGKTAVYGEYSKVSNGLNTFASQGIAELQQNSQYKMWGLGVTQDIDAAAMQLYAGYRNHQLSTTTVNAADIGIWMAGARVNF